MNGYDSNLLYAEITKLYNFEWKKTRYYKEKLDFLIQLGFSLTDPKIIHINRQHEKHLYNMDTLNKILKRKFLLKSIYS